MNKLTYKIPYTQYFTIEPLLAGVHVWNLKEKRLFVCAYLTDNCVFGCLVFYEWTRLIKLSDQQSYKASDFNWSSELPLQR